MTAEPAPPADHRPSGAERYAEPDPSYRALTPGAALLYRLLALNPTPRFRTEAAAWLLRPAPGHDTEEARGLLDELVGARLLTRTREDRYLMHDAVRRHAARRLGEEGRTRAFMDGTRRMVGGYLAFAVSAYDVLIPGTRRLGTLAERPAEGGEAPRTAEAAVADLAEEHENLAGAVRAAEEHGCDEEVWRLCEALWALYSRQGHHGAWIATHRAGAEAAARLGDRAAESRMRCRLALAHLDPARLDPARLDSERLDSARLDSGRLDEAEDELLAAVRAGRAAGHTGCEAAAVASLGVLRLRRGRPEDALELLGAARELAGRDGDPGALSSVDQHTGRALTACGRFAEALDLLAGALADVRATDDRWGESWVLTALGELHLAAGRPADAAAPLDQALALLRSEGGRARTPAVAVLRADCARALGRTGEERRFLSAAIEEHPGAGAPEVEPIRARLDALDSANEPK